MTRVTKLAISVVQPPPDEAPPVFTLPQVIFPLPSDCNACPPVQLPIPATLSDPPINVVAFKVVAEMFVEVTLPPLIFVNPIKAAKRLVEVALIRAVLPRATVPLAEKLVEVRLVKTPVFGVVAPMVVLLMVPPTMVRASATMASVTELFGKAKVPETFKFVVVALVTVMFVPFAVVKVRPASEVAPVILRLVEVELIRVVLPRATVPLAEKLVEVRLDIVTLPRLVGPVMFRLVAEMLVEVSEVPLERVNDSLVVVIEVNIPLVEVRLVKTPVLGVVAPIAEPLIGVLIIEPALIVILSTTMASVTELLGKLKTPETERLVDVTLINVAPVPVMLTAFSDAV